MVGGTGQYWAALGCTVLYCAVLGCTRLYWASHQLYVGSALVSAMYGWVFQQTYTYAQPIDTLTSGLDNTAF